MAARSMDEIQADYISAMGRELGANFYELYKELIRLHVIWQQYCQLFGDSTDTVQLLNRTASLFFKIVQDELWDSVLLGISRMTDPAVTGKKKNLTLRSLPPLIADPSLKEETHNLCVKAVAAAAFAREHRNKRIAHQDHSYLIDRQSNLLNGISRVVVEDMLASLRDIMNYLDNHFRDSTVLYEDFIGDSGARLLIHNLTKFEHLKGISKQGA